jgi:hypothetical protein
MRNLFVPVGVALSLLAGLVLRLADHGEEARALQPDSCQQNRISVPQPQRSE